MKIYFAGSIRGGTEDQHLYRALIEKLRAFGQVLTEHVGNAKLTNLGETALSDDGIFQRDVSWIHEADVIVAEVSKPSLGVGYEIGLAESLGKPVICLYRDTGEGRLSAMIAGNSKLMVHVYKDVEGAVSCVEDFLQSRVRQS